MTRGYICNGQCAAFYTGKPGAEFSLHTNDHTGRPTTITAEFCVECADIEAARFGVLPEIHDDHDEE